MQHMTGATTMPITPDNFKRINNDINGNPRYVCHYTNLSTPVDRDADISQRYNLALARARTIGGRKFHNKQYGGGIVFGCVYNLDNLCTQINELTNNQEVTA
jgi:hypothetical protein